jgi:alcohol dehydrogenase class IV
MAANVSALRARVPQHPSLEGYATISRLLTGQSGADVKEGIDWVRELCIELTGPALRAWGVNEVDMPGIAEKADLSSSMKANPIPLKREELMTIVSAARQKTSILESRVASPRSI